MHESSLAVGLVRRIESIARAQQARRVVEVAVSLGALSHLSAEHFREHFQIAAAGTAAEDAHLDIDVRTDLTDPHAHDVLLRHVEVEAEL